MCSLAGQERETGHVVESSSSRGGSRENERVESLVSVILEVGVWGGVTSITEACGLSAPSSVRDPVLGEQ